MSVCLFCCCHLNSVLLVSFWLSAIPCSVKICNLLNTTICNICLSFSLYLQEPTLIRNARSLALCQLEVASLQEHAIVLKWTGLSLFVGTTFTSSRNTRGKWISFLVYKVSTYYFTVLTIILVQVWEEALQHPCPHFPLLPCEGRRPRDHWPVQVKAVVIDSRLSIDSRSSSAFPSETLSLHPYFLNTIVPCRPLSKTVRFNVLKVIPAGSKSGAVKKAFTAAWDSESHRSSDFDVIVYCYLICTRIFDWKYREKLKSKSGCSAILSRQKKVL